MERIGDKIETRVFHLDRSVGVSDSYDTWDVRTRARFMIGWISVAFVFVFFVFFK